MSEAQKNLFYNYIIAEHDWYFGLVKLCVLFLFANILGSALLAFFWDSWWIYTISATSLNLISIVFTRFMLVDLAKQFDQLPDEKKISYFNADEYPISKKKS